MLFIDYSSAFNSLVPARLVQKLKSLGLGDAICKWIFSFLTGRGFSFSLRVFFEFFLAEKEGLRTGDALDNYSFALLIICFDMLDQLFH